MESAWRVMIVFLSAEKIQPFRLVQIRSLPLWFLCPADWNRHPNLFSERFRDYICSIISWAIWTCHPRRRQTAAKQALSITKKWLSFSPIASIKQEHYAVNTKKYFLGNRKLLVNCRIHTLRLRISFNSELYWENIAAAFCGKFYVVGKVSAALTFDGLKFSGCST